LTNCPPELLHYVKVNMNIEPSEVRNVGDTLEDSEQVKELRLRMRGLYREDCQGQSGTWGHCGPDVSEDDQKELLTTLPEPAATSRPITLPEPAASPRPITLPEPAATSRPITLPEPAASPASTESLASPEPVPATTTLADLATSTKPLRRYYNGSFIGSVRLCSFSVALSVVFLPVLSVAL
jgi:hypothetical protein